MSGNAKTFVIGVAVWIVFAAITQAQESGSRWAPATGGAIPPGAIAYGRESDGREQYVCRGGLAKGIHLGKIANGFAGCNVGYGGREVTLASYEVLANPVNPVARQARLQPFALSRSALVAATPQRRAAAAAAAPAGEPRRGFDENGQPYFEQTLADGTIQRTERGQVTMIHPDGTKEVIRPSYIMANAPPPTPPELPGDPLLGRAWVERHDQDLNFLIRSLINFDESEIKKFEDGARKAVGDDLFKQISYRTQIAQFLAKAK
ncbi:MAG TPA: DM9 repeat-containing protein [Thermoanaerobaculia bacterium]|nr:DM9 repeat-containing protein [Thermoanaerobaculia bacterium]